MDIYINPYDWIVGRIEDEYIAFPPGTRAMVIEPLTSGKDIMEIDSSLYDIIITTTEDLIALPYGILGNTALYHQQLYKQYMHILPKGSKVSLQCGAYGYLRHAKSVISSNNILMKYVYDSVYVPGWNMLFSHTYVDLSDKSYY
jgi:hypothetical protein